MLEQSRVEDLVRLAQAEAAKAIAEGNPLFGAVLTDDMGKVVITAHNTQCTDLDPTAHSEINLLRAAGKTLGSISLSGYLMFSNAEPCSMCMSATIKAGIRHIYYGAPHEPHLDPYLPAADVVQCAGEPIYLYTDILNDECVRQIAEARKSTPPPD
jgi:tRNA(Arg) A34 adenosine deaminase TadA